MGMTVQENNSLLKDPRKVVLVSVVVVLALMFGVTFIKESIKNYLKKESTSNSVFPTKAQNKYENWRLFRNGYAFPLPSEWKNSSDIGGTAVLEPRDLSTNELKNIQKISVTVLSDKKAKGQRFTTEREFIDWTAVTGEVQGTIQKRENITIDGEKAIVLIDRLIDNKWKVIVWIRKDQTNLYLNFDGVEEYDAAAVETVGYITSRFSFVAPAMTGKEGKN